MTCIGLFALQLCFIYLIGPSLVAYSAKFSVAVSAMVRMGKNSMKCILQYWLSERSEQSHGQVIKI